MAFSRRKRENSGSLTLTNSSVKSDRHHFYSQFMPELVTEPTLRKSGNASYYVTRREENQISVCSTNDYPRDGKGNMVIKLQER